MGRAPKYSGLCGARKKDGGICRAPAGRGTEHLGVGSCSLHGGNTPSHAGKAAFDAAKAEVLGFGQPVDVDPHEALLLCIRIAAGEVDYATGRINELKEHEILLQREEEHDRPLSEGKDGENTGTTVTEVKRLGLQLNAWIRVRHDGMDRLTKYSTAALRAGLEERMVKIAEVQGAMFAAAIQGILRELGVADHPEAPRIVRHHLAELSERAQT